MAIQSECEGQLNALLASAKAEYNQAKAAGTNVDVAALGAKYLARAAGLPLDLVTEVRETYESRLVERQAEIMAKAP